MNLQDCEIIEKENGNIINCAEDVLPQKVGEINSFIFR